MHPRYNELHLEKGKNIFNESSSLNIYKIDKYEIFLDNKIGFGGYSVVYLGRCCDETTVKKYNLYKTKKMINEKNGKITTIHHENIVAIKKIIVRDLNIKIKKAISDEIQIMKQIKQNPHENIVECYDVIDDIDAVYIIMEFCDSGDFSKIVGTQLDENTINVYFRQIVNGLRYLDFHHIIHRDIKPKNILLTDKKNKVKICDFGLAKINSQTKTTKVYTICGSPLYMAPEMFRNEIYDETIDIWSIGIILYELLFCYNPFHKVKDKHELEELMLDNNEILIPIKQRTKDISNECIFLLKRLLQKESHNRITFKELFSNSWLNLDGNKDNVKIIECDTCNLSPSDEYEEFDNDLEEINEKNSIKKIEKTKTTKISINIQDDNKLEHSLLFQIDDT